jgi:uncharacterized protein YciI
MTSAPGRPCISPRTWPAGTFADPQDEGSMAIFTTREAAETFANGDPFVLNGVVRRWSVREWNEAIAGS